MSKTFECASAHRLPGTAGRVGRGALLRWGAVVALLVGLSESLPCRAGLVEVQQAPPIHAPKGSSSDFDVLFVNNTASSVTVSGFTLELSLVGPAGVQYTNVDTNTLAPGTAMVPYIFGTLQSPPFSFDSFPNTHFTASDTDFTAPFFVTIAAGGQAGLAHVSFSVAASAPTGPNWTVHVVPSTMTPANHTEVVDMNGNDIPITTLDAPLTADAPIAAVPEPSSLVLCGLGVGGLLVGWLVRRRLPRGPKQPAVVPSGA
jgi:hypothetical protein